MPSNDKPRLIPTGYCWCGCGRDATNGRFFAQGHDKTAESAYMAVYHEASVARLLVDTGFGPEAEESIRAAALDRGGWEECPYDDCDYAGAPASIRKHIGKDHKEER
ncbi:hypothetical protein [Streptomyces malaysiensis]